MPQIVTALKSLKKSLREARKACDAGWCQAV
jgi:hypothetical protein